MPNKQKYDRLYTLPVAEVLTLLRTKTKGKILYNGLRVKTGSLRLQTFAQKGVECSCCGLVGTHFALERDMAHANNSAGTLSGYHLNLYGLDPAGNEILMTQDHILPRSLGGPSTLENSQTMCSPCNFLKSNSLVHSTIKDEHLAKLVVLTSNSP